MHDPRSGQVARRELDTAKTVDFADAEPSAFASMRVHPILHLARPRRRDFDALAARVGIWVTDIDEGVTLDFQRGRLVVHNGLQPQRDITIRAEADTVMSLSNLRIGPFGLPVYYDEVGRGVAMKLLRRRLRIDGLLGNLATVNSVTRIFSVAG